MTVSSQTQRVSYAGDGSTTSFPVSFLFYSNADVSAILRAADGTETTWTENTQYTLTGAGNPNGGTLTVKTSPTDYTPASGTTLVIKRELDFVQETDLPADGAFPSESVERQLDRSVMHAQQLGEQIARSLTLPATTAFANLSLPEPASNQLLGWNAGATDLENKAAADIPLTAITAFVQTLLDDADASEALSTLGISAFIKTLLDDPDATAARATLAVMGAIASSIDGRVALFDGTSGARLKQAPPGALFDIGMIVPTARTVAPGGWLLCYGQNVSRTTYPDLFARLDTNFGAGDGSTTFGIPDLRGRVPAGRDNMGGVNAGRLNNILSSATLGATGGNQQHQLTIAEMPNHTHSTRAAQNAGAAVGGSNEYHPNTSLAPANQPWMSFTGGDGLHNNVQPTIILNYCIYTGVVV